MEIDLIQEAEERVSSDFVNRPLRSVRRRSDVWAFMEYRTSKANKSKYIECKLCGLHLTASSRSGTSNLRNHLLNRHADLYHPKILPDRHRLKHGYRFAAGPFSSRDGKVKDEESEDNQDGAEAKSEADIGDNYNMELEGDAEGGINVDANGGDRDRRDSIMKARNIALGQAAKKKAVARLQLQGMQQTRLKSGSTPGMYRKIVCSNSRAQGISNSIFRMLNEDLLPVNMIEGLGFRALVDALQAGYTFPTTFGVEERLLARLAEGRTKLAERLSGALKIGLSCDLWTDYHNRNFITVTSHVISTDWKNESWVLGTVKVKANATDVDVAQQIKDMCQDCGVKMSNVPAMVYGTDGIQSVADTTERLKVLKSICAFLNVESRPCAGELLGISVQNALSVPSLGKLIQDAGQLISHLSTDRICQKELTRSLKDQKKSLTLTICDTSSGWQVISDMFSQLAELEEVICKVLADHEANLSDIQWKALHELIQALQGVKAAVAVMGDGRNKSGSCWLPVMHGVLQHIDTPNSEDISDDGQVFRDILSAELKSRCELNEILPSSLMMQAAAIDPRFHHLRFLSDEDRVPVIEGLKQKLAENHREGQKDESPEVEEDSPFFALLGEDEFNKKSIKPEDEIDLFRLERPVSRETDPLNWWRLNEKRFPGLCKLAKGILCVPIAATPLCKSTETSRTLENRKRLDHMHVDAQLFLHKNSGLFE